VNVPPRETRTTQLGTALDLLLIGAAAAYVGFAELRGTAMTAAIVALFFAHAALTTYDSWRSGTLNKTLPQVHEHIQRAGPPKRRPLEHAAMFMGLAAIALILWA
jgi:hypothetical protein